MTALLEDRTCSAWLGTKVKPSAALSMRNPVPVVPMNWFARLLK